MSPTQAIKPAPLTPSGFTVVNPIRTWGGADAETVSEGEKQIKRFLQHRDRLVSTEDFEAIAWRAPGVEIGRIECCRPFIRTSARTSRARRPALSR